MSADTAVTQEARSGALLADDTRLGAVELTVTDLERSIRFYEDVIGLRVLRRGEKLAALGADEEVVVLHEDADAERPGRVAGIYHFALLFPTREELARAATRIARTQTRIDGASDHGTHEAIYLPDPDGIGIELAADRPRELWPALSLEEFAAHGPQPLDVRNLLDSVAGEQPTAAAAEGLRVGHIHLHVGDLDAARRFYTEGLGFEVVGVISGSAVFVSFARYHHHVAFNVWRGPGVPAAPRGVVGLRHWTLILGGDAELAALRDRLSALGATSSETDGGLIAHDSANIAVRVALA